MHDDPSSERQFSDEDGHFLKIEDAAGSDGRITERLWTTKRVSMGKELVDILQIFAREHSRDGSRIVSKCQGVRPHVFAGVHLG